MLQRTRLVACAFAVLVVLAVGLAVVSTAGADGPSPARAARPAPTTDPPPEVGLAELEHDLGDYADAVQMAQVGDYVHAVQMADVATYVDAVASAHAAEAAAARRTSQPSTAPTGGTVTDGGSCYGGPIPDYIVTRESGGNPMAQNPSGAFGCFQIMPEWWSGACSSMDRYTIAGQKACAAILWDGGNGASNWALTR